jgi:hypothetical protein
MVRILIIVIATALVLAGVSAALPRAPGQDPGPAIMLQGAPVDGSSGKDDSPRKDKGARDRDGDRDDDRDDHESFTVAHPKPIEATSGSGGGRPADDDDDDDDDRPRSAQPTEPDDDSDDGESDD